MPVPTMDGENLNVAQQQALLLQIKLSSQHRPQPSQN